MKVVIYSKENCNYCVKAKTWLKSKDINYQEIDLGIEENRNKFLTEIVPNFLNTKTVPQIFVNDVHIGGYTDLIAKQEWVLSQQ